MFRIIHYHRGERRQVVLDPVRGILTIGRHPTADVQILDPSVSRRHARVFLDDNGTVWIEDLKSFNGTFIEGHQVTLHELQSGVDIRCGEVHLIFISAPTEELALEIERKAGWDRRKGRPISRRRAPRVTNLDGVEGEEAKALLSCRAQLAETHRELAALHARLAVEVDQLVAAEVRYLELLGESPDGAPYPIVDTVSSDEDEDDAEIDDDRGSGEGLDGVKVDRA